MNKFIILTCCAICFTLMTSAQINYTSKTTTANIVDNKIKSPKSVEVGIEIGQKFTDLNMKDPNDKEVALSNYVGKGKYVLIDFWASWCGACRLTMHHLIAAYEKFASKEFEIVGVSLDDNKEDWLKGVKKLGITWPQMSDLKGWESVAKKTYDFTGIPSTILVNPNGIIIAKDIRPDLVEKKLAELLK